MINNTNAVDKRYVNNKHILLIIAVLVICLTPFISKPFHIDDPFYIWVAEQIQKNPLDPYDFNINWYGYECKTIYANWAPPLTPYFIAVWSLFFGKSEISLHILFSLFSISTAIGLYLLAGFFCKRPLYAVLFCIFTPAFMVSSTTIMTDPLLLMFSIWCIYFWVLGVREKSARYLIISMLLFSAAILTKYNGAFLCIPLIIYAYIRGIKKRTIFFVFGIPAIIFIMYAIWMITTYDLKGFLVAFSGGLSIDRPFNFGELITRGLIGFSFLGGSTFPAAIIMQIINARKKYYIFIVIAALVIFGHILFGMPKFFALQFVCFLVSGILIIYNIIIDHIKKRIPESLLLFLWIILGFILATFLADFIAVRFLLPIIPAIGILLARMYEDRITQNNANSETRKTKVLIATVLLLSFITSFYVALADQSFAKTARDAAIKITSKYKNKSKNIWFQGHWGFQYYMQKYGAKPLDSNNLRILKGDIVVIPDTGAIYFDLPEWAFKKIEIMTFNTKMIATTMNNSKRAGFYASKWVELPYSFGKEPTKFYYITLKADEPLSGPLSELY